MYVVAAARAVTSPGESWIQQSHGLPGRSCTRRTGLVDAAEDAALWPSSCRQGLRERASRRRSGTSGLCGGELVRSPGDRPAADRGCLPEGFNAGTAVASRRSNSTDSPAIPARTSAPLTGPGPQRDGREPPAARRLGAPPPTTRAARPRGRRAGRPPAMRRLALSSRAATWRRSAPRWLGPAAERRPSRRGTGLLRQTDPGERPPSPRACRATRGRARCWQRGSVAAAALAEQQRPALLGEASSTLACCASALVARGGTGRGATGAEGAAASLRGAIGTSGLLKSASFHAGQAASPPATAAR